MSWELALILLTQVVVFATALIGLIVASRAKAAIQEVHISINSRMDTLLKLTASASHAEGMQDQKNSSPQ